MSDREDFQKNKELPQSIHFNMRDLLYQCFRAVEEEFDVVQSPDDFEVLTLDDKNNVRKGIR